MGSEGLFDTELHEAVHYGDIEEVEAAVKSGLDPNQIGIYQWSALHEAAHNGDLEILSVLLAHQGDPNRKDLLRGCTAVHYAAAQGHHECLKALLDAGGQYDITNQDHQSPFNMAKTEVCQRILREKRDSDILTGSNIPRIVECELTSGSDTSNLQQDTGSEFDSACDPDSISIISIGSGSSGSCRTKPWKSQELVGFSKDPALGHIQLSFEYNSKKSTLKIRVWQVMDLLLPPAETSQISSMYVKSWLHPDKHKVTKRKTEEVRVDKMRTSQSTSRPGQHVFKAANVKFTKGLEYDSITSQTIADKIVEVELTIVQKYTRKSYVIASQHLPLKDAVKKLVKTKFPLKPRIGINLPDNMKVYDASDLVEPDRNARSHPNLRIPSRSISIRSFASEPRRIDTELESISVDTVSRSPSIEISMPEEEDEGLNDALKQIAIMEAKEDIPMTMITLPDDGDEEDLLEVKSLDLHIADVEVHMDSGNWKSYNEQAPRSEGGGGTVRPERGPKRSRKRFSRKKDPVITATDDAGEWDYHQEELQTVMVPIDFENDLPDLRPATHETLLPMAVSLSRRDDEDGYNRHLEQETEFVEGCPTEGSIKSPKKKSGVFSQLSDNKTKLEKRDRAKKKKVQKSAVVQMTDADDDWQMAI